MRVRAIMAGMSFAANLDAIQAAIREAGFDGWLFYDHHHRDPIAGRILGLDEKAHITRRWFYFVPAEGEPRKLVHRIEQGGWTCCRAPRDYIRAGRNWRRDWSRCSRRTNARHAVLAQQRDHVCFDGRRRERWSFYASLGKQIVSSADLVSQFEAVLSDDQVASHAAAQRAIDAILAEGWREIAAQLTTQFRQRREIYRIRARSVAERGDAPRGSGLGERTQCQRQRQLLRLALRADCRALCADSGGRFSADRYLGQG